MFIILLHANVDINLSSRHAYNESHCTYLSGLMTSVKIAIDLNKLLDSTCSD